MSFDRDGLEDRLDPSDLRERIDERVDVTAVRERLEDGVDPATVREGLDDLYVRYFMPPSVTEDAVDAEAAMLPEEVADDFETFDFGAWLQAGRETGPTAPPAEPRVVTGAAEAADPTPEEFESFDFTGWLSDGETYEPVDVLDPETGVTPEADADLTPESGTDLAPEADRPLLPRPSLHPVKAATFALFLSVVALVGLTVVGYLPALGPATGFGP